MPEKLTTVHHGTDFASAERFKNGEDLFYAYTPRVSPGTFASDLSSALFMSYEIGRANPVVTTWEVPTRLLTITDQSGDSVWYRPNKLVRDLMGLPREFLDATGYYHIEIARVAVEEGTVVFFCMPNKYYKGFENADTLLSRYYPNS